MPKDVKRVASGKKSKRKGSSFELALAKRLEAWWGNGARFRRTPGSGGWSRAASNMEQFNSAGDIVCGDSRFPLCIEAKNYASYDLAHLLTGKSPIIMEWWKQAVDQTPTHAFPLLVFKRNNMAPLVMLSYQRFPDHNKTVTEMFMGIKTLKFNGVLDETLIIMSLDDFLSINPADIALEEPNAALQRL